MGVRNPLGVKGIPDREEGKVPVYRRLVVDKEEEELVEDEANVMVYANFKNEGAEEGFPRVRGAGSVQLPERELQTEGAEEA